MPVFTVSGTLPAGVRRAVASPEPSRQSVGDVPIALSSLPVVPKLDGSFSIDLPYFTGILWTIYPVNSNAFTSKTFAPTAAGITINFNTPGTVTSSPKAPDPGSSYLDVGSITGAVTLTGGQYYYAVDLSGDATISIDGGSDGDVIGLNVVAPNNHALTVVGTAIAAKADEYWVTLGRRRGAWKLVSSGAGGSSEPEPDPDPEPGEGGLFSLASADGANHFWELNGNGTDSIGSMDLTANSGVTWNGDPIGDNTGPSASFAGAGKLDAAGLLPTTNNQPASIEFLFRPTAVGGFKGIVSNGADYSVSVRLYTTGQILLGQSGGTVSLTWEAGTEYHLVAVWNGTAVLCYVNGVQVGSFSQLPYPGAGYDNFQIGANGNNQWFSGEISNMATYPTALAAGKVLEHAEAVGLA